MIIPEKYQCELCSKEFDTPREVRDEIAIMNGNNTRCYAYVCAPCIARFIEATDDLFPKNKYALRIKEANRISASTKR